jgi:hypothetical protein
VLARNVVDHGELLCSQCRLELTANVRSHVYGCPLIAEAEAAVAQFRVAMRHAITG